MIENRTRREFLQASVASTVFPAAATIAAETKVINVVVWDERQPEQKQAYDNFLGNQIADHLKSKPGLAVKSVSIEDDEKGCRRASSDHAMCWSGGDTDARPRLLRRWFSRSSNA